MRIRFGGLDGLVRDLAKLGEAPTSEPMKKRMRENVADLKVATVALSRVDTHTMEQSVYGRTRTTSKALIGEVGVTAQSASGYPYPVRQHEDMSLGNGPKSALKPDYDGMPVGPKFLERPLLKYEEKYRENLERGLQDRIRELSP